MAMPRECRAILVEDQEVVNVNAATNSQLLKQAHDGTEELGAHAGGFGHTKADGCPLQALARDGVQEAAVFPLRWGKAHRKIAVRKIDQHPVIPRLNGLCHRLDGLHLEGPLDLELVQRSVVGAQPKTSVLLRDRENGRFKIPERFALGPAKGLRAQAIAVVFADGLVRREDGHPLLGGPTPHPKRDALPRGSGGPEGLIAVMAGGGLHSPTNIHEPIDLRDSCGQLKGPEPNRARAPVLVRALSERVRATLRGLHGRRVCMAQQPCHPSRVRLRACGDRLRRIAPPRDGQQNIVDGLVGCAVGNPGLTRHGPLAP